MWNILYSLQLKILKSMHHAYIINFKKLFCDKFSKRASIKANKSAKIRNRYNQAPHLTQDTIEKVTNAQLYTTNESQEVSPFQAGDHKSQINRGAKGITTRQKKKYKRIQKKYCLGTVSKIFYWRAYRFNKIAKSVWNFIDNTMIWYLNFKPD